MIPVGRASAPGDELQRARLVETIRRHSPDVVGFQEVQSGNLETYTENLPRYDHLQGPEYGNAACPSFNAIFFDVRRLRLLDSGGFWLSTAPERYSSSWASKAIRSANWAYFDSARAGLSLLHLNTHLDHVSDRARVEGSRLIIREISNLLRRFGEETPVLVTGDFNCRPWTPAYRSFLERGFADTYLATGNEDGADAHTFHAFKGSRYRDAHTHLGPRRIDWILLKDPRRRLRALSHVIVRDHAGETYPSDHYPLLADLAP